jgi:hypothetical protein
MRMSAEEVLLVCVCARSLYSRTSALFTAFLIALLVYDCMHDVI